jgi:hypothetical protein
MKAEDNSDGCDDDMKSVVISALGISFKTEKLCSELLHRFLENSILDSVRDVETHSSN